MPSYQTHRSNFTTCNIAVCSGVLQFLCLLSTLTTSWLDNDCDKGSSCCLFLPRQRPWSRTALQDVSIHRYRHIDTPEAAGLYVNITAKLERSNLACEQKRAVSFFFLHSECIMYIEYNIS